MAILRDAQDVVAVVVLFRPDERVWINIDAVAAQVRQVVLVDNTPGGGTDMARRFNGRKDIVYLPQQANLGVAAALNVGARHALASRAEYLLTMDQDSRPSEGMVVALRQFAEDHPVYAVVAPFHQDLHVEIPMPAVNVEDMESVMTSGSLVRLKVYEQTDGYLEPLFIDGVDDEYCLRVRTLGWRVARLNSARLMHSLGRMTTRRFLGMKVHPTHHDPERYFFQVRNHVILRKLYRGQFPRFFRLELRRHIGRLVKMLCFEKDRLAKVRQIIRGYAAGFRWKPSSPHTSASRGTIA